MRSFFLALFLGLASPLTAQSGPVQWFIDDQPPQFILEGPDKGKGSVDGVLAFLQARLPQFQHSVSVANVQRSLGLLQTDGPYAGIGYVKTPEREKLVLFSKAFAVGVPAGMMFRRSDLPRLQPFLKDGKVDLEALLASKTLRVGVAAGRSYGPATDAIVTKYQSDSLVLTRFAASGIMAGLYQMLSENRVDAIFAFRGEVRYVIRDETKLASLVVLPLLSAGNPITIHVIAPRTDWGRALIAAVDRILVASRMDPAFRALSDRWTDDETKDLIARLLPQID